MGWGHWLLLDDVSHQRDLSATIAELGILQQRLNKTALGQASVADELRRLTAENNELKLYVATVFRLLLDKQIVNLEELESLVTAIDREDGAEDGRHRGPVLTS
ncbi:MAG: hypothetical protein DWQ37_21745 [Planctomycetota bacterium]|nr:MAG: hypothetical protein DWQ37_21745 [Planctomycetota bacterium]